MLRDALTHLDLRIAPVISLTLFFGLFLLICYITLRSGEAAEAVSEMPLDDGAVVDPTTPEHARSLTVAALPDKPRDHSFDGITEYDNPLPQWWLWIFYITIAFSLVYFPYMHWPGTDRGQEAQWQADVSAALAKYGSRDANFSPAEMEEMWESDTWQAPGKELFIKQCARCHNEDGSGNIGPNMTDDYYLHGGRLVDLATTITEGVPEKGMIPWKNDLYPEQIKQLACYVKSLRGNEVTTPKDPQGWPCDEEGVPIEGAEGVNLDDPGVVE